MNIVCSSCHTDHEVTREELKEMGHSVLQCRKCSKNIKIQFCPHCNAFYSITFSSMKSGQYRYKCRKCGESFSINFDEESGKPTVVHKSLTQTDVPLEEKTINETAAETEHTVKDEVQHNEERDSEYINRDSIHRFSVTELFKSVQSAFTVKKITASAIGVVFILALSKLFSSIENLFFMKGLGQTYSFMSSFFNLFPLAIIFTFFILTAAVISKFTLNEIFMKGENRNDEIISFALKSTPSILIGNITVLLAINSALILFGKIPFLGPLLFSIAFLPLYIASIAIFLITFVGIWFYPAIAAHRENGVISNIKNLMIFIKKHNFRLLTVIPIMSALSVVTFGIIFIIHSSSLALVVSGSTAILSGDASVFFSSIPSAFVKASEFSLTGIDSSIFKGLYTNISVVTQAGGLIMGISMTAITILLMSMLISVVATVSTHFYIMIERGLNIEDKKNLTVLSILVLLLTVIIQLKKLFH